MTKTISAYKLRTNLGEVLNEVYYKGVNVIVERKGKPLARIVKLKETDKRAKINEPLFNLIGLLSKEAADELERNIKDLRKRSGKRSRKIAKILEKL